MNLGGPATFLVRLARTSAHSSTESHSPVDEFISAPRFVAGRAGIVDFALDGFDDLAGPVDGRHPSPGPEGRRSSSRQSASPKG